MRVNGADSVTTAVLIGNTPEVNENFYTYDVSESDYKKGLSVKYHFVDKLFIMP